MSRDGSGGDCGGLPVRRIPVGFQTTGRSRAAKASTGGKGIVEPVCVCMLQRRRYCQGGNMSRWGLIETAAGNCSLRP